jgi:hypothetical protein
MATAGNVIVGKPRTGTGGVFAGATSLTLPVNASTALPVGFIELGYVSEDGLTQTIDSETTNITAWGGDTVKTVKTSHDVTYTLAFIETSEAVLTEVFGSDNVDTASGVTSVKITSTDLPRRAFVFEMQDSGTDVRVVVPNGQITNLDDISWTDGDPVSYPVTISAYPDEDGVKAYLYLEQ